MNLSGGNSAKVVNRQMVGQQSKYHSRMSLKRDRHLVLKAAVHEFTCQNWSDSGLSVIWCR